MNDNASELSPKELQVVLECVQRRMGEIKHGGGSDWQDYYLVYEPIARKLLALLRAWESSVTSIPRGITCSIK